MKTKPFTQLEVQGRAVSPESLASIYGPKSYEALHLLTDKQRRDLVHLAKLDPGQEAQFLQDVTCRINTYRADKDYALQERPAAIAASMRQVIKAADAYTKALSQLPDSVLMELGFMMLPGDWRQLADAKATAVESEIEGHRPPLVTGPLVNFARELQLIARQYSKHLASTRAAMQRWLGEALIATGEKRPGKNDKTKYFEALMWPEDKLKAMDEKRAKITAELDARRARIVAKIHEGSLPEKGS